MDLFWQFRDCFLAACHHSDFLGDSAIVDAQAVFCIPMKFCVIGGCHYGIPHAPAVFHTFFLKNGSYWQTFTLESGLPTSSSRQFPIVLTVLLPFNVMLLASRKSTTRSAFF